MYIDALRRRADDKWLWLIPLVPGGAVYYFFAVKFRDPGMQMLARRMLDGLKRPPSVRELSRRYKRSPSVANRVLLAQGLFDAGRFADAKDHFEGVLESRPKDADGLYGLGCCDLELGEPRAAVEPLSRLVDVHPSYRDYAAWSELSAALWKAGDKEACHEALEELVRKSPRLAHIVLQSRYLRRDGRTAEARQLLRDGLADHKESPRHVRRLNRPWASAAKRMLEERAA